MIGVIACGALSADLAYLATEHGLPITVHPLPPLLHNHPERIAEAVRTRAGELGGRYDQLAIAYADCGTFGALDQVAVDLGLARLGGAHCYDVYAGVERLRAVFETEPGTYVLTDYLALSFQRSVVVELGLDVYPELRDDYFGHYRRVVWLAGRPTPAVAAAAQAAADAIGLPLETVAVGLDGLLHEVRALLNSPVDN